MALDRAHDEELNGNGEQTLTDFICSLPSTVCLCCLHYLLLLTGDKDYSENALVHL